MSEIVSDNPRANFLEEVSDAVKQGGTVTVRGGISNKYFKSTYNGKAAGMDAFEIVKKTENVGNPGYKHSDGQTPVEGQVNEIVLKKK